MSFVREARNGWDTSGDYVYRLSNESSSSGAALSIDPENLYRIQRKIAEEQRALQVEKAKNRCKRIYGLLGFCLALLLCFCLSLFISSMPTYETPQNPLKDPLTVGFAIFIAVCLPVGFTLGRRYGKTRAEEKYPS